MSGLDALVLLDGIDDNLIAEAEDAWDAAQAAVVPIVRKKRERRPLPAFAAAACVAVFALVLYLALLGIGSGLPDRLAALFRIGETEAEETDAATGEPPTEAESGIIPDAPAEGLVSPTDRLLSDGILFQGGRMYADGTEEMWGVTTPNNEGTKWKCDMAARVVSPICLRPACRHETVKTDALDDCPLGGNVTLCFTYGNKLYYRRTNSPSETGGVRCTEFACYNYVTGDYHTILSQSVPYDGSAGHDYFFAGMQCGIGAAVRDGSKAYILYAEQTETWRYTSDVPNRIGVIDLENDTLTGHVPVEDELIHPGSPVFARDGKIIFAGPTTVSVLDADSGRMSVVRTFGSAQGLLGNPCGMYLIGDWLWMLVDLDPARSSSVVRLNIVTGEAQTLWEPYVDWFCTDGQVVYVRLCHTPNLNDKYLNMIPENLRALMAPTLNGRLREGLYTLLRFDMDMTEWEVVGLTDMKYPVLTEEGLLDGARLLDPSTGITTHLRTGKVLIDRDGPRKTD